MVLSIKDQRAQYNQLMKGFEEGKKAGLQIARDTREPSPRSGVQHPTPRYGIGGYEDNPYDDFGTYRGPTIPNPNPGQGFDWAHGAWDVDSLIEKWGAVQDPAGEWMLPTKEGTLRYATPEEQLMIEEDFQHRKENSLYDGHEHQAMYNPNDTPQKMFKVTDKDKELNNPAWQRFIEGNPNYMYVPLQKASIYMGEQFPNEFDRVLNPKGDFSRPSLDQLREGVKIKKKTKAI